MDRLCPEDLERLARLESPTRNRYFYGKLLTERHFDLEQRYFNRKRWLLNRLTLGSGVICGLNVVRVADGKLQLSPGVAIDGFGREIVVPEASRAFDPTRLTDECGQPAEEAAQGPVTICLAYHECDVEPVPARVTECETEQRCAPSLVLERYKVLVLEAEERPAPPEAGEPRPPLGVRPPVAGVRPVGGLRGDALGPPIECRMPGLFERSAGEIHHALVGRELEGCAPPGRACVALARVENGTVVRDVRSLVYPAPLLYELILCLSQRVEKCCHALTLRYVSGDVQHGGVGQPLPEDLVVQVVDAQGRAVANEEVTFRVQGGGGRMQAGGGEQKVTSGADGMAAARWVLGPVVPVQTATASLDNGVSIGFHAVTGVRAKENPPKVTALWPSHASAIKASSNDPNYQRWLKLDPHIELTFDQPMDGARLANPNAWLGVYWFRPEGTGGTIRRLTSKFAGAAGTGANAPQRFQLIDLKVQDASAKYVVLIRAENDNIVAASPSDALLDADFSGTRLTPQRLAQLWAMQPGDQIPAVANVDQASFAALPAPLPSGDGSAGGIFHGFFEVS